MTGFGSLYYTDCLPGQGKQGSAGFQFQAATPGVATEAMGLVQRAGLYEPPSAWMRERRPVADYPASLAHTTEGGIFATAAGRYLGQEANGTRQGNQFTHAVVSRDPADYGAVRPAQMWGAPWWVGEPAAGTELGPLPEPPAAGPLDTESVRNRIRDAVDGRERLLALLSAVHHLADPERRRAVVLVSADPEEAACWIAAVTLLLPRRNALRTSFKIFVADAQYGRHDIIALHPEWAGRWADTDAGSGLAVFDLDRGRYSAVEPTPSARFWVPRFLTEDAYDVVDAVELAGQFAADRADGAEPAEPTDADRLVAMVVEAGEDLAGPERLDEAAGWLRTAPEQAIHIARDTVLDAVLDANPPAQVLRTLADAAGSRGWPEAAAHIQGGLLIAEIGEVLADPDGVAALQALTALPKLRLLPRPDEQREQGRAAIEAAVNGAGVEHVAALLEVAARHGVPPSDTAIQEKARDFAWWWLLRTEPALQYGSWHPPPAALTWVREVLRSALADADYRPHAEAAVRHEWWRHLWKEAIDPGKALDALLMSTAYLHLTGAARAQLMREVQVCSAARMPGADRASTVAWEILFDSATPALAEAMSFVRGLLDNGMPMSGRVAERLGEVLAREPVTEDSLWVNDQIRQQGRSLSREQDTLRRRDDAVQGIAQELRFEEATRSATDVAKALNAAGGELIRIRADVVVDGLLAAPADRAVAVLQKCSREAAIPIYKELEHRWPQPAGALTADQCRAVAFTFVLMTAEPGTEEQRAAFRTLTIRLGKVVAALSKEDRAAVEKSSPGGLGEPWREWVSEVDPAFWRKLSGVRSGLGFGKSSGKDPDKHPGDKHPGKGE